MSRKGLEDSIHRGSFPIDSMDKTETGFCSSKTVLQQDLSPREYCIESRGDKFPDWSAFPWTAIKEYGSLNTFGSDAENLLIE